MLWTDADFISAADLTSLDNEVAAVATAENITLAGSGGVIHRAIEEAGDALLKHQQQFGGGCYGSGSVSPNHYAAVMNTGLSQGNKSRVLLNQVVITGPHPNMWGSLKRWAVYWALMLFYRDAANRTNNDRYDDKATRYNKELHNRYWSAVRSIGLPIVRSPLPCPGALYEPGSGSWGTDNVTLVNGTGTKTDDWDVAVTWLDAQGVESHPSARATVVMESGKVLRVDISSLTPPDGNQPAFTRAQASVPYRKATSWNVYAGPSGGTLRLQTTTPLGIAVTQHTLAGDPSVVTRMAGDGQAPDSYLAFNDWVQRT